ncbi:ephexin-1 isoform X2 [Rhinatrema bivittatum]|uniref:ephexin-1 isoform X2 n=1 Tax=Rhinatrema bivittatum TaxID=194408 RepID=UPI00112E19EE|nr:ephexin-1 isoform X2 [Rhinatrema bivittatum]
MTAEALEKAEQSHSRVDKGVRKSSVWKRAPQLDVISDDEEEEELEASDHVKEGREARRQYIPIRRNSRYYRSVRVRNRQKREGRSSKEKSKAENTTGSLECGDCKNDSLNVAISSCKTAPASVLSVLRESKFQWIHKESQSATDSVPISEECPDPEEYSAVNPDALQTIFPLQADSWKALIEHIELLYQEYRDKSTQQEIETRRQHDAYVHADHQLDLQNNEEIPTKEAPLNAEENRAPPPLNRLQSSGSSFNLWQDLPEIRNSGVLDILQPEEIKLQEAMFELVTSEASYYKSLSLMVSLFVENENLKTALNQSEAHFLFSNILEVLVTSERFLLDLEQRMEENIVISDVCDIIYQHAANHFGVYITYVCNQTYQERTYRKLLQEKSAFREVISELELNPKCKGLPFSSFLILPFQRITRLKLLVQNILTKVPERSERENTALQAHRELEKVVRACNEGVRKMSRTEQLISIEKTLEFKIKSVPIISHSRWLLKQGELQQMSGPKTSRTLRTKKLFRTIYLFLFNDLLLMCKQLASDRYQVFDSATRGLLRVEELEDQGQALANVFILRLLENVDEREVSYMLKATSQSEMKRWMTSLAPNRRTKFVSLTSRLLDCPQMQCVHSYVAQEPDELSLELADILNILDKTDDDRLPLRLGLPAGSENLQGSSL